MSAECHECDPGVLKQALEGAREGRLMFEHVSVVMHSLEEHSFGLLQFDG